MADYVHGQFSLQNARFVIEDVTYEYLPSSVQVESGKVRVESVLTADVGRLLTRHRDRTGEAWHTSEGQLHSDVRAPVLRTFKFGFDGSYISTTMMDHLTTLYSTQKAFWLQFDDLFSDTLADAICQVGEDSGRVYLLPTYPIGFFATSSLDGDMIEEWAYVEVYKDGVVHNWEDNPYRIDTLAGMLRFEQPFVSGTSIQVKHLCRVYGRISAIQFTAIGNISQNCYTGAITFEQLTPPTEVPRVDDAYGTEYVLTCDTGLVTASDLGSESSLESFCPAPVSTEVSGVADGLVASVETDTDYNGVAPVVFGTVPDDAYVHGIEISELFVGVPTPDPTGGEATVKVRTRLSAGGTWSDYQQKLAVNAKKVNHALNGEIDGAAGDFSYGGQFDLFEEGAVARPFGCISPSLLNSDGIDVNVVYEETGGHYDAFNPVNWAISYSYLGYKGVKDLDGASIVGPTAISANTESQTYGGVPGEHSGFSSYTEPSVRVIATWIGGGDAPIFCPLRVSTSVSANAQGVPWASQYRVALNDGFGQSRSTWAGVSGEAIDSLEGSADFYLPVASGVASVLIEGVRANAYVGEGGQFASSSFSVTGSIYTTPTFLVEATGISVRVHHTIPCETVYKESGSGTPSGSWNHASVGVAGGDAISSDFTTSGAFALLLDGFDFSALSDTCKITGVRLACKAALDKQGTQVLGDLNFKVHIGAYNAGNPATALTVESTAYERYTVGGMHSRFGHESTWADTGVEYPTKVGLDVKGLFQVEVLGTNVVGARYLLQEISATVFYVEVET